MAKKFTAKQKQAWKEAKQEEQRQMIEASVEALTTKKAWQDWIRFGRNNLRKYSVLNALLINSQYPGATLTKGRVTWMNEGFLVNDDAKPISILAPQMVNKTDEEGNVIYGDNGKPVKRVGFYRVVTVYDVKQTNAPKDYLPKQARVELQGDDFVDLVPKLEGFARELGYVVRYSLEEGIDLDHQLHEIRLTANPPVNYIVYNLVVQLAKVYTDAEVEIYTQKEIDVISASAACLALGQLGFDTRKTTVPFIAAHDNDLKTFKSYVYTVEDIAKKLAEVMS